MNKTELINQLAYTHGLTKTESREIVEHVFSLMSEALAAGEDLNLTGFASFRVMPRAARRYRHNGKLMEVPAGKRVKVSMSEKVLKRVDPAYELESVEVEE